MGFGGNPNEPSAMRGGPMFELLFGIDTWLRRRAARSDRADLLQCCRRTRQAPGRQGRQRPAGEMAKRRIDTHSGHKPLGFSEKGVDTEGGHINADLILFMPGLTGPAWAADSGLTLSAGGFFKADEFCRVEGADRIFVAGDSRQFPRPRLDAKAGPHGRPAGQGRRGNLLLALDGKPPMAKPKTELICIVDTVDSGILVYRDTSVPGCCHPAACSTGPSATSKGTTCGCSCSDQAVMSARRSSAPEAEMRSIR
jgi:sulfide:quinone oxidoreductase